MENIIKKLNQIKPRQEWVSLLKSEIINSSSVTERKVNIIERKISVAQIISEIIFQKKFAYASMTLLFMIVGVFGFARLTTPGDIFYPVKKIVEQSQQTPLQIAYNRSEDLVRVVSKNKTQNLTPAINEYKASISDAVKNLSDSLAQNSGDESINKVIDEVIKIKENQRNLQVLGVNVGNDDEISELTNLLSAIVKNQIADFEDSTLTEEQQKVLAEVKELNDQEKYSEALELILEMKK
jgi:hypothetical protein